MSGILTLYFWYKSKKKAIKLKDKLRKIYSKNKNNAITDSLIKFEIDKNIETNKDKNTSKRNKTMKESLLTKDKTKDKA